MKLRTKILLLLLPLTIIPLFLLGWIAYDELRETSERAMFNELRTVQDRLSSNMNREVQTAMANVELFSKNTLVREYVLTSDDDQRYSLLLSPLLRALGGIQEAFPEYYEIRILLPDGYEDARLTSLDIDNITDEERDSPFFQSLMAAGERTTTRILQNPDNNSISLYVGKPLVLRNRAMDPLNVPPKLRAYLSLTIDIKKIVKQIVEESIGETGYLLATDIKGNVIFHHDEEKIGSTIAPALLEAEIFDSSNDTPLNVIFNNKRTYITGVRLHPDLLLFSVLPEDDLLSKSHKLGLIVAAITLLTIIVSIASIFTALEYLVVKPVHKLRDVSKEIGRGQWDITSGVSSQDELGELARAVEDMASNLQKSDDQVRYLAYHDSLTGLPNRAMFTENLDRAIVSAKRKHEKFALLFMDIDDFKRINDYHGHYVGDLLLQEITERLIKILRKDDCIARTIDTDEQDKLLSRLGGDEFIILLPEIADIHSPSKVAQRIIEIVSKKITLAEHDCYVGASIGITLYPNDGSTSAELTKNADIAMYHAKEQGKNTFHYYTEAMNVANSERIDLENRMRKAIENEDFFLHYQPQVHTVTGEIVGLEALLRWQDPQKGMIGPNIFIPVAEQTGLIIPIGEWVLIEACRQMHTWQKEGYPHVKISVNVSSIQFARQDVAALIRKALEETHLDPQFLEIEITESAIMSDPENAVQVLREIKKLGVNIALDDFGTGYSSLSHLRHFPIDTLKIDRSFIININKNQEDAEIVAAIIAMAHTLKLRVIIEGVETDSQLRVIAERKGDIIQGYLFSRPLPSNEITSVLSKKYLKIA